ncbi:type II toxin-antitoxin system VapC family toxin [Kibdelosporangium philippinense]|uniref:Type II toxin-antitoxin system VapC family toxin n=1 Tax=Kibdelosporangium philippinense TaxID=211113 RepID=A0ABS8ZPK3_9PSEU|nr:type II toxin-antitoxin system VapC family toxin [Kibdelosporangium philippinense]MCE7009650.1 type II toxin-antitoxin system VapC family toxin [Kibdelosporangium philippinense]
MLLLDSQVALWLLDDSPKLGKLARERILAADGVHVSAATVWELTIKSMLGKLTIPDKFSDLLVEQGLTILPITGEHAEALTAFPELARHDPFDRLIIAQASLLGLDLLTADHVLLALGRTFVIDATK